MFLRSLARGLVGGVSLGAGVPVGYRAYQNSDSLEQFLTDISHSLAGALRAAPSPMVTSSQNAEIMTLMASQQALSNSIQHLMRSQNRATSSSFLSALLPLGLLGALVAAWYKWGWEAFGWVSVEQLEEKLEAVRQYVAEKIQGLKDDMNKRFTSLSDMLTQCRESVNQVGGAVSTP